MPATKTATQTAASRNGKSRTITVRGLRLTIPPAVPLSTFRAAFKDEATNEDVVRFLNSVLGEAQMDKVWELDLSLKDGPIPDQVNAILTELADKVQKALGLELGE